MVELDTSNAVTSFTRFRDLPKELRLQIWTHALPGPRIILVERHLFNIELDKAGEEVQHEAFDRSNRAEPTYFSSPSPNGSITTLLGTCEESHSLVKKNYSLIFPRSSTWISFEMDFLYLNWGTRYFRNHYEPEHFNASFPEDWDDVLEHPEFDSSLAKKVKNLIVYEEVIAARFQDTKEEWLVQKVLQIFSSVETLVLADQFHSRDDDDSGEELVWLAGPLWDQFKTESGQEDNEESRKKEEDRIGLTKLLLWKDWTEYGLCHNFERHKILLEWDKNSANHTRGRKIPKIVRKSIVAAKLKNELIRICRSEENTRSCEDLDWSFVTGQKVYCGALIIPQQIKFLQLVLARISVEVAMDNVGNDARGALVGDIQLLQARIDALSSA